jgi:hypothetical protein
MWLDTMERNILLAVRKYLKLPENWKLTDKQLQQNNSTKLEQSSENKLHFLQSNNQPSTIKRQIEVFGKKGFTDQPS